MGIFLFVWFIPPYTFNSIQVDVYFRLEHILFSYSMKLGTIFLGMAKSVKWGQVRGVGVGMRVVGLGLINQFFSYCYHKQMYELQISGS